MTSMVLQELGNIVTTDRFALDICKETFTPRDATRLAQAHHLPADWEKRVEGKKIVCVYLGEQAANDSVLGSADFFLARMDFLRLSVANLQDVVLWWCNDGRVLQALEAAKTGLQSRNGFGRNAQTPGKTDRFEKAEKLYRQAIENCKNDNLVLYDDTGNWETALAWSDAYYGEQSSLSDSFRVAQKPIWKMNFAYIGSAKLPPCLDDWLGQLAGTEPYLDLSGQDTLPKRIAGERCILCCASNASILRYGIEGAKNLRKIFYALRKRNLYTRWLIDKNTEDILACMKSEIREEYQKLWDEFEEKRLGILDTSGNLENAIKYCDGYYGDYSGSIARIASAGFPAVWGAYGIGFPKEIERFNETPGMLMSFVSGCWVNEEYYFTAWHMNGLFKIARNKDKAEYVARIPFKSQEKRFLASGIFYYGNKLFVTPTSATEILVWDIQKETWESYDIDSRHAWHQFVWFTGAFQYGGSLWLKPTNYGAIAQFDMRSCEMNYFTGWGGTIKAAGPDENSQYLGQAAVSGGDMWITALHNGYLLWFSLETYAYKVYDIPEARKGFASIACDGTALWLYTKDGDLLRWTAMEGTDLYLPKILEDCPKLGKIIFHNGSIFAFANYDDAYAQYEISTGKLAYRRHYLPEDLRAGLGAAQLSHDDTYIYILPNGGEWTVRFDPCSGEANVCRIGMVPESEKHYAQDNFKTASGAVGEWNFYDANELALYFRFAKSYSQASIERENVGASIYRVVCSMP